MPQTYRHTLAITAIITFISTSAAAEPAEQPPVVVTATRFKTGLTANPVNVTVITSEDISRSGANNLAELLSTQTGTEIQQLFGISASKAKIDMGGFGATGGSNTLVLLNGRRLNDVDLSGANLALIPLDNIARVEIMHGSGTVLYGDNATAGVINIITRNGFDSPGSSITLQAGSYQTGAISARTTVTDGTTAFHIQGDTRKTDGYRENNALDHSNALAELTHVRGEHTFGLRLQHATEAIRLPGALNEPVYLVNPRASVGTLEHADQTQSTVELYVNSSGFAAELANQQKEQRARLFGTTQAELDTTSLTPRVTRTFGAHRVTAGLDIYHSSLSATGDFGAPNINRADTVRDSRAIYLADSIGLSPAFTLGIGARKQHVTFENQNTNLSTGAVTRAERRDQLSAWDISLSHYFTGGGRNYLRLAESFRFPVLDEVWSYFSGTTTLLRPQQGKHTEIGTLLPLGARSSIEANIFHITLRDEIAFDSAAYANINLEPTRHDGVNLTYRFSPAERWTVRLGATYREATFRSGTNMGKQIPEIPRTTFLFSNHLQLAPKQQLTLDAIHKGPRYFGNDFANVGKELSPYTLWNARYAYDPGPWRLTLTVRNLFDKQVADTGYYNSFAANPYYYYPLPGRSFLLSLEARV